ncbi:MAG: hypothetical protein ACLQPH_11820 [Acidimicrobiales bacterium]
MVAVVGSGVATAAKTTTFDGNISCNLSGTVTVKPPITATSTGPYTVTFKGKNGNCVGLLGTSITQNGETLVSSTEAITYTVPASSTVGCAALLGGGGITPVPNFTIKWKGTSKITPTVANFPNGGTVSVGTTTGVISFTGGPVVSGWSSPPTPTIDVSLGFSLATLVKDCGSAKGLSKFAVNDNGGDNLEIGPAF